MLTAVLATAFAAEVGAGAYLADLSSPTPDVLAPQVAPGLRLRFRWSDRWATEAAFSFGAFGDPRIEVLRFLGDPSERVVPFAALGGGVFLARGGEPGVLVDFGMGLDIEIAPVLDLRTDARARVVDMDGPVGAMFLLIGPQFHTPRPRDQDGDGLLDREDGCATEAEDRDGHLDGDGCADPDNDADGVPDLADACPDAPEDVDGIMDVDGCPDETPAGPRSAPLLPAGEGGAAPAPDEGPPDDQPPEATGPQPP